MGNLQHHIEQTECTKFWRPLSAVNRQLSIIIALFSICLALPACGDAPTDKSTNKSGDRNDVVALWGAAVGVKIDTMHLGRIAEGEIVKSSFTVRNISASPLVIIDVKVACGCAKATFDTSPVMPNTERRIDFTFNSSGRRGAQIKYFDLQSADGQNIKIFFDAEVI